MEASTTGAPTKGATSHFVPFGNLSEEEQIEQLIKLFDLAPILRTPDAIKVSGDTRTDFYGRQDPNNPLFDPSYPEPIGGRRSGRASRSYWTVDILRWRIRLASFGKR